LERIAAGIVTALALTIADTSFAFARRSAEIAAEAALGHTRAETKNFQKPVAVLFGLGYEEGTQLKFTACRQLSRVLDLL
jgi:hypothetical protein